METNKIFIVSCAAAAVIMLSYYLGKKRSKAAFISGTVPGIASLLLLEKVSVFFGLEITLNIFNIAGSLILGVPFVVVLIIMNFL